MKINLVIPAAGLGSRFRAMGIETPKPLIPVLGIPMIGWVIANFQLGLEDDIWIITRKFDQIPKKLDSLVSHVKNKIHFIELENLTDGAATTLQYALDQIPAEEAVLSANSDQFVTSDISEFVTMVRLGKSEGQILTMTASDSKWSYVERNVEGRVVNVVEKVVVSNEATVGVYGWKSMKIANESINSMKTDEFKVNGEFYVAPSYNYLIKKGALIETYNVGDVETGVHGLGTPEDLELFLANPEVESYKEFVISRLGIER